MRLLFPMKYAGKNLTTDRFLRARKGILKVGGSNPSPATNLFTINHYLCSPDGELFRVGTRAESQISHMYFLDLQVFGHKT